MKNPILRPILAAAGVLAAAASLSAAEKKVSHPAPAQGTPNPAPCGGPEFRQLDFWVGTWNATWPASPGTPAGKATNRVEKILGGCVVSENFEASGVAPLVGKSYST